MAEPPAVSVEVAVTFRVKSSALLADGVIFRLVSCAGVSVALPFVTVMAPLLVPPVRVAPFGMPVMVMAVIDSEPSVSVSAVPMFSAIAVSSLPEAAWTVTVGVSATALTVTARLT